MAITNFIPTVWSENLGKQLEKRYVAIANCSHEWEGEIKQKGDKVKIVGLNNITITEVAFKNGQLNIMNLYEEYIKTAPKPTPIEAPTETPTEEATPDN